MFRRMFRKIIEWAMNDPSVRETMVGDPPRRRNSNLMNKAVSVVNQQHHNVYSEIENMNGLDFRIYSAVGGRVVQTSHYDPNTDRNRSSLYVITDKEDLGDEIAQIITRESLSR